jgi:hypothetical protein
VIPLLLAFRGLERAIAGVWRDPETKALPVVAGVLVLTATIFYWRFEKAEGGGVRDRLAGRRHRDPAA